MFEPGGPTFFELAEQALSSTERGYDKLASKFDKTPFRTPDAVLGPVADWIGPFDRGVDFCCGTGAGMASLLPYAREGMTGVDMSEGMLAIAASNLQQRTGGATLQLVRADAIAWDGAGRFDLAVSFGAFGHILADQELPFLRSVHRALRPGGRFVFVTARNPGPGHPLWWAARAFNAAIRLRNVVVRPAFHMYYLTFTWPEIDARLREAGFETRAHEGVFDDPRLERALVVEAIKPQ